MSETAESECTPKKFRNGSGVMHEEEFDELEEEEEGGDPFDITPKKPTIESLRRWRQATLALNAARRFRYTLDLKALRKEEDALLALRQLASQGESATPSLSRQLSKFRTSTHVLRAVHRFRVAGERRALANKFDPPPTGFRVGPNRLARMVRDQDVDTIDDLGGVPGIAKALNSHLEDGIKDDPADLQRRWEAFGENKYAKKKNKNFLVFLWEASQDTTLIILMVCAAVSLATGMKIDGVREGWYDGAAIGFAVLLVIAVTATSDYRQSLQFRSLNDEKENIQVQVVRGGRRFRISIFQLAVGDIVTLDVGDQVPADGLFVCGHSLTIDDSSMTGESEPVHKDAKHPFLLGGCKVADGHAIMLITGVGMRTEWGEIMATLSEDNGEETPLQVRLNGAATFIGQIGLTVAVLVFIVLIIRYFGTNSFNDDKKRGSSEILNSIVNIFTISVTIVVVAVPEGLPLAVTLSLAYSMRKMMADKSLVRKLAACETMGSATTICSDKTGTLTLNQMTVVRAWVAGDMKEVDQVKSVKPDVLSILLDSIALNTVGAVFIPEAGGEPEVSGSPTESAILEWGLKLGMKFDQVRSRSVILRVEPFSSTKKRAGVVARLGDGVVRVFWKGAAEIILADCVSWLDEQGSIHQYTVEKTRESQQVIEGMAASSLRCVAFAYRDIDPLTVPTSDEELNVWAMPDDDLTFISVVGIKDPCRPGVRDAVAMCQAAAVKVRMVTGDNIMTARAIAQECGILTDDGVVVEGQNFRNFTEEEFKDILPKLDVMARSSPTDKLLLVKKLKEESANSVIAVTGDGTNDAPALHEADIGLSMGISGTEVAKEASDIIILDDNFASVVKVVRWGRSIYANIQKFIQFQLTVNVTALIINFVAACSNGRVPLNAVQLLWVNLIMDTLGALALATEPPTDDLMQRKPVGRKEPLITNVMWRNLLGQSFYQVTLLLVFTFAGKEIFNIHGTDKERNLKNNTIIFNTFVFCQLFNEFNARRLEKINVFEGILKNHLFIGIVACSVVFQVVLVQYLTKFAQTTKLSWRLWLICVALGAVSLPLGAIVKLIPVSETPWRNPFAGIFSSLRHYICKRKRKTMARKSFSSHKSSRKSVDGTAELMCHKANGELHCDEDGEVQEHRVENQERSVGYGILNQAV